VLTILLFIDPCSRLHSGDCWIGGITVPAKGNIAILTQFYGFLLFTLFQVRSPLAPRASVRSTPYISGAAAVSSVQATPRFVSPRATPGTLGASAAGTGSESFSEVFARHEQYFKQVCHPIHMKHLESYFSFHAGDEAA
jgi:hypothetical protein